MNLVATYYNTVYNFPSFNNFAFLFALTRLAASVAFILFAFIASNIDDGITYASMFNTGKHLGINVS